MPATHARNTDQFALFDTGLCPAQPTAKLALPIAPRETIDIGRVRSIFGVSNSTVRRMMKLGYFRYFRLSPTSHKWNIDYSSVIEYCDRLRVENGIPDTRRPLSPARPRHPDADLLPFPARHVMSTREVAEILQCHHSTVLQLTESGLLTAYQVLIRQPSCPWRIDRRSFERYLAGLHQAAGPRRAPKLSRT